MRSRPLVPQAGPVSLGRILARAGSFGEMATSRRAKQQLEWTRATRVVQQHPVGSPGRGSGGQGVGGVGGWGLGEHELYLYRISVVLAWGMRS